MYKIINLIKSKLKKYLPNFIYFPLYSFFKKIQYALSNHTEKDKLELRLTSFTKPLFKKVTVDDISFEIFLDPNNGLVDKEIYAKDVWEKDILLEIKSHLTEKSVCLDIGANIGQHALYMSRVAHAGKVYAFEPVPGLAKQIQKSVEKNSISNVEVCNFGLSNTNETREIYFNNLNMGNTTFKKRLGASGSALVETKMFDSFWQSREKIDFIKMDVEGYEYYALLGMKKSIEQYHPTMIIEFSPLFYRKMNISSSEFLQFIFDLGYTVYDLDQNKREVTPSNMEDFIASTVIQTNILCISKY